SDRPGGEAAFQPGVPQAEARDGQGDRREARRTAGETRRARGAPQGDPVRMKLGDLLKEGHIATGFQARDKWEAIDKMVDLLIAQGAVKAEQREVVISAL